MSQLDLHNILFELELQEYWENYYSALEDMADYYSLGICG